MSAASRHDATVRARYRHSILTEAARVFGPSDSWSLDLLGAIDRVTGVSDIGALRGFAFLLANTVRRPD